MGIKLRTAIDRNGKNIHTFYCPGCKHSHMFNEQWSFSGDMNAPTFSPSLLNYTDLERCHLFVKNGKIEYLSDCKHALAGQTIEMEDVN
jgi:hypothetical protein